MKKWILIDSSMNVLLINSSEFINDIETKEYISKNLDKVIRCKNITELNKTIKNKKKINEGIANNRNLQFNAVIKDQLFI